MWAWGNMAVSCLFRPGRDGRAVNCQAAGRLG
jgi:hypothetical protein